MSSRICVDVEGIPPIRQLDGLSSSFQDVLSNFGGAICTEGSNILRGRESKLTFTFSFAPRVSYSFGFFLCQLLVLTTLRRAGHELSPQTLKISVKCV